MSDPTQSRLQYVPVTLFTIVMGLCGFTLALRAGENSLGLTHAASWAAHSLTMAVFAAVALGYLAKAIRHPAAVAAEWRHPVKLAFFPAISIALVLMSIVMLAPAPAIAHVMWLIAVPMQLVLTLAVVSGWISARAFQHGHLSPAWFIPAVGNVIVAIAGVPLGYPEISWFFTSVGLIFWLVLLSLVMNRLIFHDPLPERLQPSLVILIAPPSVGFLAWVELVGGVDAFVEGFAYSDALKGLEGEWTVEKLSGWIENPRAYAPGNRMGFPGLKDEADRANLIGYLQSAAN